MSWWDAASSGGTGNFWGDLADIGGNIAGSVLPAIIANEGADSVADATRAGNQASIDLQRGIYQDQVNRSEPWRKSGFNALNFLNLWNGLPQVSDGGAFTGSGTGAVDSQGRPLLPGYGAGAPVPGHTGGGGSNPLTSTIGAGIGQTFGGPIGGAIGGALGGLIRNGGDNWQTYNTQAPAGYGYDEYFNSHPNFATEWAKPDVRALFGGNRDAYLWWHANGGEHEGRQQWEPNSDWLSRGPQPGQTTPGTGTGTGTGTTPAASATPDLWSTITNNPLYVAAKKGFLGVDKPEIDGAFATGGQALSGAQKKALFDRGTARSYGAVSDIYRNYAAQAGLGASTADSQNSNAGQFGSNAGNLLSRNGEISGQAAGVRNANWANAAGNALTGAYDWGKRAGWIN